MPVRTFDTRTGRTQPLPRPGSVHVLDGFQGDLATLNGRRFFGPGGEVAYFDRIARPDPHSVFGPVRSFHAGDQIEALARALGDGDDLARRLRAIPRTAEGVAHCSAPGVRAAMDDLSTQEALYRLGGLRDRYDAAARRLGIVARRKDCALTDATSHDRRTSVALRRLSSGKTQLHESLGTRTTERAPRKKQPFTDAEMRAFAANFSALRAGQRRAPVRRRRKASGRSRPYYDPDQPTGAPVGSTRPQRRLLRRVHLPPEDVRAKKGPTLQVETDMLLTNFASARYSNTRRFVLALAGGAVDCLLFHDFHTARPGAMYGDLTCAAHYTDPNPSL